MNCIATYAPYFYQILYCKKQKRKDFVILKRIKVYQFIYTVKINY
jgi:hypothetical protein